MGISASLVIQLSVQHYKSMHIRLLITFTATCFGNWGRLVVRHFCKKGRSVVDTSAAVQYNTVNIL